MQETLIDGRYRLLEAIGSGGEARVFRARDTRTGDEVAVRVALRPATYAPQTTLPFFPPGWVHFIYWGVDPQQGAYQVFELLHGQTLRQLLAGGALDSDGWFLFANQSLEAVAALHETGWVHGDLNADNFFHNALLQPPWKLLELPFLRFDPPADRTTLFGSIHTLAPEQFEGNLPDFRSDQYALGCLYYYAACGDYPHSGATGQEIAIERLRFEPVPLVEKAPHLPTSWCEWVMTLLARVPQSRFPTVAAAHQLLRVA